MIDLCVCDAENKLYENNLIGINDKVIFVTENCAVTERFDNGYFTYYAVNLNSLKKKCLSKRKNKITEEFYEQLAQKTEKLAEFIPTRYGYDFDGWYSDPQTKENRVTNFTFNESDTVYAKWIPNGMMIYNAPAVQRVYATDDEILAFDNYIDEKTGVPVTAQWVKQNKRLNELMEIHNEKFCK